jgi:hypothetical protein
MKKILIIILVLTACKGQNKSTFKPDYRNISAPPTLVYKTKSNYNNLVPVLLSEDKTEIISYPHPKDLKVGDTFALPTTLKDGYLLDNRGIGPNVAFLKITYEEYSKLDSAPSLKELYDLIIDKDPLSELCNCGNRNAFNDKISELNKIIKAEKLKTICRQIK